MANKSARDKCFEEAMNAYNDAAQDEDKIPIQNQKPWGKVDGQWRPIGTMESIWNWITNKTIPYRVPDWTLTLNGKPVAGDNKFSGDQYDPNRRGRSGQTQLQDQNDMNNDQNPGQPGQYDDLHLNPDECGCKPGKSQPQEVIVPVPAPFGLGVPGINPVNPVIPAEPVPVPEPMPMPGFGFPGFAIP